MDRRKFLLGLSAAALPTVSWAGKWKEQFDAALDAEPALLAWRSTDAEALDTPRLELYGRIPARLRGTLYRNGPARHDLGGQRYRHWFDGDGMVQAFRFTDAGVSHAGRFVRTRKYLAETEAGRFLTTAFGTRRKSQASSARPDDMNVANTSVLPFAGELLALWEGGSAYRLDPRSLATLGPKVWHDDLAGAQFSAHPRVEPDGTLWNFGVANGRGLILYHVGAGGSLVKAGLVPIERVPMVHDFAVTERSLVFLLPPLVFDRERADAGASFLDAHVWDPNAPMRALVLDKADWTRRREYELPTGFHFHLGNAWEEASGAIRLDYMRAPDASAMFGSFREVMRGARASAAGSRPTFVRLDPSRGTARQEARAERGEFPRIDARRTGRRYTQLYSLYDTGQREGYGFEGVQRLDIDGGAVDRYDYGAGHFPEEHLHVADPESAREGSGWLLGTALDLRRQVTVLSVFEAGNLASGPIAQARLPYALPAGFHGNYLAAGT